MDQRVYFLFLLCISVNIRTSNTLVKRDSSVAHKKKKIRYYIILTQQLVISQEKSPKRRFWITTLLGKKKKGWPCSTYHPVYITRFSQVRLYKYASIALYWDYSSWTAAAGIRENKNKNALGEIARCDVKILWESKTIELLWNGAFNAAV